MTLRTDLTALLARAGLIDVDIDAALADEHARTAAYLEVVAVLAAADGRDGDRDVVAAILRDPHDLGAKTAVVELVDRVAVRIGAPAAFRDWAAGVLPEIDRHLTDGHRAFLHDRVHDWTVYLTAITGRTPDTTDLARATAWMQRKLAAESASEPLLALLAGSGRTRKVRNLARDRVSHRADANGR